MGWVRWAFGPKPPKKRNFKTRERGTIDTLVLRSYIIFHRQASERQG
jgi:hypothetical protein